ncbi:alcohol dehydrogenase-like 1 [Neltuma alba]|uniref:alcohol dehydrogenase-like 1 n=1 Tax=Neltuma alba TaxID=207710 RepID=UPI0010A519CA|nr:alcohol dehydrogenase-like 1 [Prosopis alba]
MSSSPQAITCKGAVCWAIGEGVKEEEIEVEPPKASEVRVKMLCASVCRSDIFSTQGLPHANYPQVLGHEGIGVVESKGEEVKNVKVGDMVIPLYLSECGECEVCIKGKTNLCMRYPIRLNGLMADNTSRMSVRGQKAYHLMSCATWCEYMVIDANYVLKVESSAIDAAHGSFISCGFSTGFGAAWKEAMVEEGSSVAVFGLGAVGLGAVSAAKLMGATKIIGIDKNEKKREKGEAFGMTHFINPDKLSDKPLSEEVKELSGEIGGVDYSIECTGVPSLLNEAMESTKVGVGKTVVVGAGAESVQLSYGTILYGRTLKGSVFGGIKPIPDLPFIAHKCHTKEIPIHELLTHEIHLEDISKAFGLMRHPDCVKVVIKI